MSIPKHIKEHIALGYTAKLDAAISSIRSGFAQLGSLPLRELATAPTITSGAATSMAGTPLLFVLGYQTPLSAFSLSAFNPKSGNTNSAMTGDNTTLSYNLVTKGFSTARLSFVHTGRYLEFEFYPSTTTVFYLKIDGKFESLTPISETFKFRKYDFGSSATRRIDLISGGADASGFYPVKLAVGTTDVVVKAPIRGPRCILVSDSYGSNPSSFPNSFAEVMSWDDVWGSGVGGSGYIATNGNTVPTFAMRIQTDVVAYSPDVVGIVGSVNDDSQTYAAIYAAALSLYQTLKGALPNAIIFAAPTYTAGADGISSNGLRNRAAKKAAATAAQILWVDVGEQSNNAALFSGITAFTNNSGQAYVEIDIAWGTDTKCYSLVGSVISLGNDAAGTGERHLITATGNSSGKTSCTIVGTLRYTYAAGSAFSLVGSSYLTGTGYVGATTGVGNADILCSDATGHPVYTVGGDALGVALADTLINAIVAS